MRFYSKGRADEMQRAMYSSDFFLPVLPEAVRLSVWEEKQTVREIPNKTQDEF